MRSAAGKSNLLRSILEYFDPDICRSMHVLLEKNSHTAHFKVYQTVRIAKLKAELKAQETACAAQWTAAALDGPYEKGIVNCYFILT